jgi:hypothetical protein
MASENGITCVVYFHFETTIEWLFTSVARRFPRKSANHSSRLAASRTSSLCYIQMHVLKTTRCRIRGNRSPFAIVKGIYRGLSLFRAQFHISRAEHAKSLSRRAVQVCLRE